MSESSALGVKRFVPNLARSAAAQLDLNNSLAKAALDNDPNLVLHYLSEGANPSSTMEIVGPRSIFSPYVETFPAYVKIATESCQTIEICALHAAIINCCWKLPDVITIKIAAPKVALIVKALLAAGADTSHRSTFLACNIPGYNSLKMVKATPLEFVLQLQVLVHVKLNPACAQELNCIVALLQAHAVSGFVKSDWVATIDRTSPSAIHSRTLNSLRVMLDSASRRFSDIVFECPVEIAAESSEHCACVDSNQSPVADSGELPTKRAKLSIASLSSSSSSSSDELSLDSSSLASASASNLVYAHRNILSASSPYFDTLFSGAWCDVSDGRIVAKQGARAIRRMLEFLYTGEMTAAKALQLPLEDLVQLHEASAEYQIDALHTMTEAALAQQVSASNLARMLQLASLHDDTSCVFGPASSSLPPPPSSSSSSSVLSSPTAPCMLMHACLAVLQDDLTLFTSDGVIDFLAGQPKLRTYLRGVLVKRA